MVIPMNSDDLEQLELELELERLGITSEASNKPETEQKPLGTLKNGVVLLSRRGVDNRGYIVYEALCPYCGRQFTDSRERMSKRDHCGCQSHTRRSQAQAKGVEARLAKKLEPPVRKPYDPAHIPLEKAMTPEEKAGWSAYLNKTMKPGGLALYIGMPQAHREVLASLLAYDHGKGFEVLEYMLKDSFLELLDLCQAQTVEFPTRGEVRRRIALIRLWERFKEGQTPDEIAFELCDDTPNIVSKLKLLQAELRDFQRRDTYGLSEFWEGERFLNTEINEDTRFPNVVL